MAKKNVKKSSSTIAWPIVRRVILGITGLLLVWFVYQSAVYFLYHSAFFKVKKIVLSSTLSVIDKKDLLALEGQSLVGLDVQEFYDELIDRYPQISDLKVYKQFPDRIRVTGVARKASAQTGYKNKFLTFDADGIVLGPASGRRADLPLVKGLQGLPESVAPGVKLEHNSLISALEVLNVLSANPSLKDFRIMDVDAGNLSKIVVNFNKGPDVIVDWTELAQKSQMLTVVLSQIQLDFEKVRYIDLRFKEPVIAKD